MGFALGALAHVAEHFLLRGSDDDDDFCVGPLVPTPGPGDCKFSDAATTLHRRRAHVPRDRSGKPCSQIQRKNIRHDIDRIAASKTTCRLETRQVCHFQCSHTGLCVDILLLKRSGSELRCLCPQHSSSLWLDFHRGPAQIGAAVSGCVRMHGRSGLGQ